MARTLKKGLPESKAQRYKKWKEQSKKAVLPVKKVIGYKKSLEPVYSNEYQSFGIEQFKGIDKLLLKLSKEYHFTATSGNVYIFLGDNIQKELALYPELFKGYRGLYVDLKHNAIVIDSDYVRFKEKHIIGISFELDSLEYYASHWKNRKSNEQYDIHCVKLAQIDEDLPSFDYNNILKKRGRMFMLEKRGIEWD